MLNLLLTLLTLVVIGGVAALFTGFLTAGGLDEPESSVPPRGLPAGPLAPADLAGLRFVRAFRGYRMDQVDAAIDRLAEEIESLRGQLDGRLDGQCEPRDERAEEAEISELAEEAGSATPAGGSER